MTDDVMAFCTEDSAASYREIIAHAEAMADAARRAAACVRIHRIKASTMAEEMRCRTAIEHHARMAMMSLEAARIFSNLVWENSALERELRGVAHVKAA